MVFKLYFFVTINARALMEYETKEKLWKFTSVVRKMQYETCFLLCILPFSIAVLVTPKWKHLMLKYQLYLWLFTSEGLCHQFSFLTPLVLHIPIDKRWWLSVQIKVAQVSIQTVTDNTDTLSHFIIHHHGKRLFRLSQMRSGHAWILHVKTN